MLKLVALLVIFPVSVFVPGFVALRRFRLSDELRLSVSVAVSLAFLYAAGFVLYLADAGAGASVGIVIALLAAAVLYRRDLLAFLRAPAARAILLHHAIFTMWLLLLSFVIRAFSGALWAGDWQEHYERAVFFLGGRPLETRFIGVWSLTARPPLDNLVAAFFLRIAGRDFFAYQLTAVLLASLEFLGAASLSFTLTHRGGARRYTGLLALTTLLCLNPSVVQNATYPWTRALTNFFVLQAAALFVLALRESLPSLRRWSFLHLGLALATHYSTVPYLIALALVELRLLFTRRLAVREAALAALLVAAPVALWLAFAIDRFGIAGTFLTNSTVAWNATLGPVGITLRALRNLGATLVPHFLREVPPEYAQEYVLGFARDYAFLVYQVSLPALMGSLGGLAVAGSLAMEAIRRLRRGRVETPVLVAVFLATVVVLGTASVADDDAFGVAHVCLQPLGVAGLAYLAARWSGAPPWLRALLGAGLLVDAAVGIGLHFWIQHLNLDDLIALNPDHPVISESLLDNVVAKVGPGFVFLGDLQAWLAATGVAAAALLALAARAATHARLEVSPAAERD